MNEIAYVGEHLTPGIIGRLLIYVSLISGVFSLIFYSNLLKARPFQTARLWGRVTYLIQTFSVVGVGVVLFYLIINHYFEYAYIFKHSSTLMPDKFIISSFWAGQEGSFLLWAIFIGLFGVGAMYTARKLEGGVMLVVVVAQLILMSMVLGVHFLGLSIGSDPFLLLREVPENMGNDFFNNPNYVSFISDGNGLNPLLENPWMVIHPPMLFMGYATAIFPYAFAVASLMNGDKRYWLKPALPWVLLTIGLLGIGLLMGGAWAYQSLTFGGFWAWDPVENASLVPWLVLVAALHYMILSYKRDKYYYGTYIFSMLGFVMVVYASYLTRSGVLGETSVHAFGDDGRSFQLIAFTLIFTIVPIWLLIRRRKSIPTNELPDMFSREFLMMYGAIVLLLSAFQIISTTSVPVINKLFGTDMAPPGDVVNFYNTWQMPFAMLMSLLLGLGQYVSYGKNDTRAFLRNIIYPVVISLIVAVVALIIDVNMSIVHGVFLFCILFVILTSLAYLLRFTAGKSNSSAAITHIGFGIFLLGVLLTFANIKTLSQEGVPGMQGGGDNMMLVKNQVKPLDEYYINYSGTRTVNDETFHQIDFLKEGKDGQLYKRFTLEPSVKYNSRMGNVHNPDTRNMLRGDIYMFVTFAEDPATRTEDGYQLAGSSDIVLGDTLDAGGTTVVFDSLFVSTMDAGMSNVVITAIMKTFGKDGEETLYPLTYSVKNNVAESGFIELKDASVRLQFEKVSEKPKTIHVSMYEKQTEFVVLKILYFPWIIVLWVGSVIMFLGVTIGVWKRAVKARQAAE